MNQKMNPLDQHEFIKERIEEYEKEIHNIFSQLWPRINSHFIQLASYVEESRKLCDIYNSKTFKNLKERRKFLLENGNPLIDEYLSYSDPDNIIYSRYQTTFITKDSAGNSIQIQFIAANMSPRQVLACYQVVPPSEKESGCIMIIFNIYMPFIDQGNLIFLDRFISTITKFATRNYTEEILNQYVGGIIHEFVHAKDPDIWDEKDTNVTYLQQKRERRAEFHRIIYLTIKYFQDLYTNQILPHKKIKLIDIIICTLDSPYSSDDDKLTAEFMVDNYITEEIISQTNMSQFSDFKSAVEKVIKETFKKLIEKLFEINNSGEIEILSQIGSNSDLNSDGVRELDLDEKEIENIILAPDPETEIGRRYKAIAEAEEEESQNVRHSPPKLEKSERILAILRAEAEEKESQNVRSDSPKLEDAKRIQAIVQAEAEEKELQNVRSDSPKLEDVKRMENLEFEKSISWQEPPHSYVADRLARVVEDPDLTEWINNNYQRIFDAFHGDEDKYEENKDIIHMIAAHPELKEIIIAAWKKPPPVKPPKKSGLINSPTNIIGQDWTPSSIKSTKNRPTLKNVGPHTGPMKYSLDEIKLKLKLKSQSDCEILEEIAGILKKIL